MSDCPSENELVEFAEGGLSAEAQRSLHDHIDHCSDCRALLSDLACAEVSPRDPTARLKPASAPQARAVAVAGAPSSQRFQILRKLGQGGMGVVYEAIDREQNRRVALKTLRSMSPDALLRFKNEFRALQDLEHPNLVRLYALVEESGQWWFTMELLSGVDFLTYVQGDPRQASAAQERIRSVGAAETLPGPVAPSDLAASALAAAPSPVAVCLDEARLRAALLQLAEGLHFLHSAGKVHRDIKPHNILVTSAGRVVILDFGLVGDRAQQDSAVVGTIAYMAPEQAAAEPVGSAADWYSVGVMLFEALTGSLPTSGNTLEALAAKLRGQVPAVRTLNPEVPPDLATLCSALLASNPASRPRGEEILRGLRSLTNSPSSKQEASPAPSAASPLFVGRQAELRTLKEIFEKTRTGREALVLIEGESGVGKSALVRQFTASLPAEFPDVVLLTGRCYEREAVPYKAFDGIIDALSRYMKRLPKDKAAALLPRRAAALLQAFPVLGLVPAMAEAPSVAEAIDPKEQRSRVFAALRELFGRLCERHPLVLWIDDLQWADADSLALLMHLMSSPEAPSLLLVCTLRPLSEARPEGLGDEVLRQLRYVDRISLGPLQEGEATELAEQLVQQRTSPHSLDVRAIAQEAGGHPLFLDELIRRAWEAPGRTGVVRLDDAIWARVSALPTAAQRLLRLSALSAKPLRSEVAITASGLLPGELADWLARLQAAHLLRTMPRHETGPGVSGARTVFEPYHDRVRETIAEHLDESERRDLHRALAVALETQQDSEPELLALHYQSAGELKKSGRYAAQAAARAGQQLAFDRAAELYRAALDSGAFASEAERELRLALGDALANAGRAGDAGKAYLAAAERAESAQALVLRQQAANQFLRGGYVEEGIEVLNGLLRIVGLHIESSQARAMLKGLWLRLRLWVRGHRYRVRQEHELVPQDLLRHDLCWIVSQAISSGVLNLRGFDLLVRFMLLAFELGEPRRVARALSSLAFGWAVVKGNRAERDISRLFVEARTLLKEQAIDDPYVQGYVEQMAALAAGELGQLRRSRDLAERAEQIFLDRCPGSAWELTTTRFGRLLLSGLMGEFAVLSQEMPRLLRESRERSDRYAITYLRCVHAQPYFLASDDKEDAERTLAAWGFTSVAEKGKSLYEYYVLTQVWFALYFEGGKAGFRRHLDLSNKLTWVEYLLAPGTAKAQLLLQYIVCRLAAVAEGETGIFRLRLLRECERAIKKVRRIGLSWANAWTLGLHAGTLALRGQRQEGIAGLRQAIPALEAVDLKLHVAICQRRLGESLGGEEGTALIEQADLFMRSQTIKNPARLARTLLPGFDRL